MGRSSGRIQIVLFLQRIAGNRFRTNWTRVEYSPRIFVTADSSENPRWFARTEHWTWEIHRPDHLHVNFQRHRLDKTWKRWNLYFKFRKIQGIREMIDSRKDTGRSSVLEMKRSDTGIFPSHLKENWTLQPLKLVERFKDTGHPVFNSISALSRGIPEKENYQGHHTLQCRFFKHRALVSESFILKISSVSPAWQRKKKDKKNRENPWPKVYWQVWSQKK